MSINRRDFIKTGFGLAAGASLASLPLVSWATRTPGATAGSLLMVASGPSPTENTRRAIQSLGGIEKFVKKGQKVFLKPNCITELGPEFAVNTNPEVVQEVARLCRLAGASQITAFSHDDEVGWKANGIGAALEAEGVVFGSRNAQDAYREVALPLGLILQETLALNEFLDADVVINIPVAKHHGAAQLTIGLKNYMGLIWDRIILHNTDLHQTIADLATVRRPDLTVVDATRILLTYGPAGPGSVRETQMVIASSDPVAADAWAATLFKREPAEIRHIRYAGEMGLGIADVKRMDVKMV
jgi:uncharacterized protein (DUF362 family)